MRDTVNFPKGMEVNQGDGAYNFILTTGRASDILKISEVKRLSDFEDGVQRYLMIIELILLRIFATEKMQSFQHRLLYP